MAKLKKLNMFYWTFVVASLVFFVCGIVFAFSFSTVNVKTAIGPTNYYLSEFTGQYSTEASKCAFAFSIISIVIITIAIALSILKMIGKYKLSKFNWIFSLLAVVCAMIFFLCTINHADHFDYPLLKQDGEIGIGAILFFAFCSTSAICTMFLPERKKAPQTKQKTHTKRKKA